MDYDMKECGGCSTCEIACSYKHTGEFNHSVSSIEIVELENAPGYKVRIAEDPTKGRIACDGCLDVDGDPLCVQYCRERDDLRTIIDHFKTQCLQKNKGRD